MSNSITCPQCQTTFAITEVLQNQLEAKIRHDVEVDLRDRTNQLAEKMKLLEQDRILLAEQLRSHEQQVKQAIDTERAALLQHASAEARSKFEQQLVESQKLLDETTAKLRKANENEVALRRREHELETEKAEMALQVERQVAAQRNQWIVEAKKLAEDALAVELKDRDAQLLEIKGKLDAAQKNELELRRRERELNSQKEELELRVAREVEEAFDKIRIDAKQKADEQHQMKLAERDHMIEQLTKQVSDMHAKLEQGSQQRQGEVQELALEELLRECFEADRIEPVGKGVNGGDVIQEIRDDLARSSGRILWESKRTKRWNEDWLVKARQDQQEAKADFVIIVSEALPENVRSMTCSQGVWICSFSCVAVLAFALRACLLKISINKMILANQQERAELVYKHLCSNSFTQPFSGIVDNINELKSELDSEMRSVKTRWKKRQKMIDRMIDNACTIYGDLQGLVCGSMPVIPGLVSPDSESTAQPLRIESKTDDALTT